jgi:hypothetical protein
MSDPVCNGARPNLGFLGTKSKVFDLVPIYDPASSKSGELHSIKESNELRIEVSTIAAAEPVPGGRSARRWAVRDVAQWL